MSEESNLRIRFYEAVYNESFGSIFATEDMWVYLSLSCRHRGYSLSDSQFKFCSLDLIPKEEADIAILEEPEHLAWFRNVGKQKMNEHNREDSESSQEDKDSYAEKL